MVKHGIHPPVCIDSLILRYSLNINNVDWYYKFDTSWVGSLILLLLIIDTIHSPIYRSNIGNNLVQK